MSAVAKLADAGFTATLHSGKLRVAPADKLSAKQIVWLRDHASELIRELQPPPPKQAPPLLSIGELLNILDGDPSVAEANRRLGECLARPWAYSPREVKEPLSARAKELMDEGWAESNARARAQSETLFPEFYKAMRI